MISSTNLYLSLLENMHTAIVLLDRSLKLQYMNTAAENLLKISTSRYDGVPIENLLSEHGHIPEGLIKSSQTGQQFTKRQTTFRLPAPAEINVDYTVTPIADKEQWLLMEISPLDRAMRISHEEQLRSSHEISRKLVRGLAHEIKNPLTPIKLSAERIRHKYLDLIPGEDATALDRSTQTIIRQVEAMRDMVNAFSEYARAPELNLAQLDINRLIRNVADLYPSFQGGAQLRLELDESLPGIQADALRMRQVLHNLIRNALEALDEIPDGEVVITTSVQDVRGKPRLEIAVRDNGPGFPAEHVEQIFEPYVTTKQKGTGLGLAIVRKLVEEHGGSVMIDNDVDAGAVIRIYLPYSETSVVTNNEIERAS